MGGKLTLGWDVIRNAAIAGEVERPSVGRSLCLDQISQAHAFRTLERRTYYGPNRRNGSFEIRSGSFPRRFDHRVGA